MYQKLLVSLALVISFWQSIIISAQVNPPRIQQVIWTADDQIMAQSREAICIYQGAELTLRQAIPLTTIPSPLTDMVYSVDYTYLFTSHENGIIYMWDIATGEIVDFIYAHQGKISDIDLRGTLLVSGGYTDGFMRIWDFTTQTMLFEFDEFLHAPPVKLAFSPTENFIVFIKAWPIIWYYEIDEYEPLELSSYRGNFIFQEVGFSPNQAWITITEITRAIVWHVSEFVPQTKGLSTVEGVLHDVSFDNQMQKFAMLEGGLLVVYEIEVEDATLNFGDIVFQQETSARQAMFSPVDDRLLLVEGNRLTVIDGENGATLHETALCRPD